MKKLTIFIEGMTCSACSLGIEKALSRKDYVQSVQVNLISKTALVVYDERKATRQDIFALITKLGYSPYTHNPSDTTSASILSLLKQRQFSALDAKLLPPRIRLIISIIFTLFVLYLAMIPMFFPSALIPPLNQPHINICAQFLSALIVMHMGRDFYFKGFKSLIAKSPTMDTLIAISTSAALIYSLYSMYRYLYVSLPTHDFYFESICVIISFVLLGKSIEENAKTNANNVINALLSRTNKEAIKLDSNNTETKLLADQIQIGDKIKILPGSYIPVDGIVINGEGGVDESMLSGEVLPVYKKLNDSVFAGSLNTNQSFIIKATTTSAQSTLSAIVALIQEALSSKTQIATLANKVAAIFVPSVITIAIIAGIFWSIYKDFPFGFEIFISVLVISCPCALGLATPMAIMVGNTRANKHGIFFKNAHTFEILKDITSIVFDKTGTLTKAKLHIQDIQSFSKMTCDEILALCAGIEKGSEHLIAKAILESAQKSNTKIPECSEFKALAGYGIQAKYNNELYVLGNKELFSTEELAHITNTKQMLCVYLAKRVCEHNKILGAIFLEDSIKDSALSLITKLRASQIQTFILSGDNEPNTQRIASLLGIKDFKANAKPRDKLDFILALKAQNQKVMMVGDGVNDVGALEAADVSLSFSNASDVSQNCANIIVFNDDLDSIDYALRLSNAVVKNIKQNLFWAFCYNSICIPLACGVLYSFGILLNPMIAAFAMSLSSVSVVLNAQRLRKFT